MCKHIVLVNLPPAARHDYGKTSRAYPATGVLIVGTVFKSLGFKVKVVDGAIESDYAERVLAAAPSSSPASARAGSNQGWNGPRIRAAS